MAFIFPLYGANRIKTYNMSPDAFVQMAIQLANYRMRKVFSPTYEASQTHRFLDGRTETTRSLSSDSKLWCLAMENSTITDAERHALLKTAVTAHGKYAADAAQGKGCDRHLFGLKVIAEAEVQKGNLKNMPKLFLDPMYNRSKYWSISTSNLSNNYIVNWGWGEVVPDGVGVAYSINSNSIHFNVTARKGDDDICLDLVGGGGIGGLDTHGGSNSSKLMG